MALAVIKTVAIASSWMIWDMVVVCIISVYRCWSCTSPRQTREPKVIYKGVHHPMRTDDGKELFLK